MKMIVIGSSSGGLVPTQVILDELPADLDAAVLIVRHSTPGGRSLLKPVLEPHTEMPVVEAYDGCIIRRGNVYVTPPGVSVTMNKNAEDKVCFALHPSTIPTRKGRPSIDSALMSAASIYGVDCIGVVLSGYLNDGTQGAVRIDRVDGTMIVQSPADAEQSSMPMGVIKGDSPDFVVPSIEIGAILRHLVTHESSLVRCLA